MKTKLNITRKSIIAAFAAFVAFTMVMTGCVKDYEMDLPLAVTSRDLQLEKTAGSTHVLVYADGEWTAHLTRPVKWASLDRNSGYGNHEFVFSYTANYGISRKVGVVLKKGALLDTVVFTQAGAINEPSLTFSSQALSLTRSEGEVYAPISTNLQYALADIQAKVVYYDENGLANEPVEVEMTRQDEDGEEIEGEEGEGGDDVIEPEEPVAMPVDPWISDLVLTKKGLTFKVSAFDGLFPRNADVTLYIADAEGDVTSTTCSILQTTADPMFALEATEGSYTGLAQSVVVLSTDNNVAAYAPFFEKEVVYDVPVEEGMEWVKSVAITSEGLQFNLTLNDGEVARKATINLSYTDAAGNVVSASYAITQAAAPRKVEFAAVRAMTPGELQIPGYIEGIMVGDYTSKNICSNAHIAQFKYDTTDNDKTNYVQSLDGKYGFMIKFEDSAANNVPRYSKVKIAVAGLTLVKHVNPDYFILTGLTAENIMEVGAQDSFRVLSKEKKITELTDDDIFTAVVIKDLEIMCKDGAYTNWTEGYTFKDGVINKIGTGSSPRVDCAPLMCYDREGNHIAMLTNSLVPWRRDGTDVAWGTVVQQGSGDFKAVIVPEDEHTELKCGDLGRYHIRAMVEEDIAFTNPAFTTTIVEWNWNDSVNDLIPEVGAGTINKYGASNAAGADFNNTYIPQNNDVEKTGKGGAPLNGSTNQKGQTVNGAQNFQNTWWDFTNDVGKYFDIEFSTAGISGSRLMLGMVWWTGGLGAGNNKAPQDWQLLYSIDGGTTFNRIAQDADIQLRSQTWYTTSPIDTYPGGYEMMRNIPADAFGKEKVILRLQATSKVNAIDPKPTADNYATALCQRKGTLTSGVTAANQQVRIGTITVRYN